MISKNYGSNIVSPFYGSSLNPHNNKVPIVKEDDAIDYIEDSDEVQPSQTPNLLLNDEFIEFPTQDELVEE